MLTGTDFKPISPPIYVFKADGNAVTVYGWATADGWLTYEPVVANPDGPGCGRWRNFYGSDPWRLG